MAVAVGGGIVIGGGVVVGGAAVVGCTVARVFEALGLGIVVELHEATAQVARNVTISVARTVILLWTLLNRWGEVHH